MNKLYLISGSDEVKIAKKAKEVTKAFFGDKFDFNFDVIQPSDENNYQMMLKDCLESLRTPSFFGTKTIWLKAFPFDKEPKATEKTNYANNFNQLIELCSGSGMNFVMSGIGINRGKKLYKKVNKLGKVIIFDKLDMKDKDWRIKIGQEISLIAQKKEMQLSYEIKEFLIEVIGVENGRIEQELEKLKCYFGDSLMVLEVVEDLCSGGKQTAFWSLNNALGKRNLVQCFDVINRFFLTSKNDKTTCMGLIANVNIFFEQLIYCRLLMQILGAKSASDVEGLLKGLSEEEISLRIPENILLKSHPYRLKMLCKDSLKFTKKELLNINHFIVESSRKLISRQISSRLVLENLVIQITCR